MFKPDKSRVEKRNLLSSFFITLLIGIAYQEMISGTSKSILESGITVNILLLILIFFLTSMRFFIGNQLHLLSDALLKLPGLVWLFDLMIIIIQSIMLILLGSSIKVDTYSNYRIGFFELIVTLYVIDIFWIISQWLIGKLFFVWKRKTIPWAWAILNSSLVVILIILDLSMENIYSLKGLVFILIFSVLGFIADIVLIDNYKIL
jgi:hypothetical protein